MSYSDSELIMSKRKRELHMIVIVLRGVPGSGKTTTAKRLYEMFYNDYYGNVFIHSRDMIRQHYCNNHSIDYQESFRDACVNTFVRDKYFFQLFELLHNLRKPSVIIIDATNTKINDLYSTLRIIFISHCCLYAPLDVYIYTKRHEYQSLHGVPECIMQRFREELKESDEWLNQKKGTRCRYDYKIVNKVALK